MEEFLSEKQIGKGHLTLEQQRSVNLTLEQQGSVSDSRDTAHQNPIFLKMVLTKFLFGYLREHCIVNALDTPIPRFWHIQAYPTIQHCQQPMICSFNHQELGKTFNRKLWFILSDSEMSVNEFLYKVPKSADTWLGLHCLVFSFSSCFYIISSTHQQSITGNSRTTSLTHSKCIWMGTGYSGRSIK